MSFPLKLIPYTPQFHDAWQRSLPKVAHAPAILHKGAIHQQRVFEQCQDISLAYHQYLLFYPARQLSDWAKAENAPQKIEKDVFRTLYLIHEDYEQGLKDGLPEFQNICNTCELEPIRVTDFGQHPQQDGPAKVYMFEADPKWRSNILLTSFFIHGIRESILGKKIGPGWQNYVPPIRTTKFIKALPSLFGLKVSHWYGQSRESLYPYSPTEPVPSSFVPSVVGLGYKALMYNNPYGNSLDSYMPENELRKWIVENIYVDKA